MADVVDLAAVKLQLNIAADDHSNDAELGLHISAASDQVERLCGPCSPQTFTEIKPAGQVLALNKRPVISVTSVTPRGVGYDPIDTVTLLPVDPNSGIVQLAAAGYGFLTDTTVVYEAGRDSVPASLKLAALIIVQHLWKTQRAPKVNRPGDDDTQMLMGYAVPNRAVELMRPYMIAAAVA